MSEDIIFIDTAGAGPGASWETFGVLPRNWQTGCGSIDDEHRAIFEFINEGWREAVEGDAVCVSRALELLASLHLRMWQHFAHEEAEMARFSYPALSESMRPGIARCSLHSTASKPGCARQGPLIAKRYAAC